MSETHAHVVVDLVASNAESFDVCWPGQDSATQSNLVTAAQVQELNERFADLRSVENVLSRPVPNGNIAEVLSARLTCGQKLLELLEVGGRLTEAFRGKAPMSLVLRLTGHTPHPATSWRFELLASAQGHLLTSGPTSLAIQHGADDVGKPRKLPTSSLRVLFMAYSPRNAQPVLDHEKEEEHLHDVLAPFITRGLASLEVVEDGTLDALQERLKLEDYDVVHLTGHGVIRDGAAVLLLEDIQGQMDPVGAERLANALKSGRRIPDLVLLSSCHSADAQTNTPSLTADLVTRGLPNVLGWTRPVRDDLATEAAAVLYDALCRKQSPAAAANTVRVKLHEQDISGQPNFAWATLHLATSEAAGFTLDETQPAPTKRKRKEEVYRYLDAGRMRVLERGFVGRRSELQQLTRLLRSGRDDDGAFRAGALLLGMKGVGKSCLAARALERHQVQRPDTLLLVLHGELEDARVLLELRQLAEELDDDRALETLDDTHKSATDRIRSLLLGPWKSQDLLIILDDFEQNLLVKQDRDAEVQAKAAPLLGAFLTSCRKGTPKLLITTTSTFQLADDLQESLLPIELGVFQQASIDKLWARSEAVQTFGRDSWQAFARRLGCNARILDWARQLIAGKSSAELKAFLSQAQSALQAIDNLKDPQQQNELARVFLRTQAIEVARKKAGEDVLEFLKRARVYEAAVPTMAFDGFDEDLTVDTGIHLQALANQGLLEVGRFGAERAYRVSPLVEPEFTAHDPARWHTLAAHFWKGATQDPLLRQLALPHAWTHGLAGEVREVADEAGRSLYLALRHRGLFPQALEHCQKHLNALPDSPLGLRWMGETEQALGNLHEAKESLEKSTQLLEQAGSASIVELGHTLHALADVLQALGNLPQARHLLERSIQIKTKALGTDENTEVAASMANLAGVLQALGDLPQAKHLLERSIQIDTKVLGTDEHTSVAASMANLACVLLALGDLPQARQLLERSIEIDTKALGTEEHSSIAASMANLACVLQALGDLPQARQLLERSIQIKTKALGTDEHTSVAASMANLAGVLQALGDLPQARQLLERSIQIKTKALGTDEHTSVAASLHALAGVLKALGDLPQARQLLERSIQIETKALGTEEHTSVAASLHGLAALDLQDGNPEQAIQRLRRVLEIEAKAYGTREHYSTAETEFLLAKVLAGQGQQEEAGELMGHALQTLMKQAPQHPILRQFAQAVKAKEGDERQQA